MYQLCQPVVEQLQTPGPVMSIRVYQLDVHGGGFPGGEYFNQFACRQIFLGIEGRDLYQTQSGQTAGDLVFDVVDGYWAIQGQGVVVGSVHPFPGGSGFAQTHGLVAHHLVLAEMGGRFGHAEAG